MDEITDKNNEPQPNTQPAENGNQGGGKLFTQAEVDKIIKERLARERAKAAPQEPTEAEKREKDLTARENRLSCRAYLMDNSLPSELLDVLDTSDIEKFRKAAATVSRLMKDQRPRYVGPLGIDNPRGHEGAPKSGFEPDRKHTPKHWPPRND